MKFSEYTAQDLPTIARAFSVNPAQGLSLKDALDRQKKYGGNSLAGHSVRPWNIFLRQFKSSFIYLLMAAAGLSFILGEMVEGWAIIFFLFINASLGFYQEYRSEQTVKLLKRYVGTRAKVLRGGSVHTVPTKELVPGDMVVIEAGDNVPADMRITEQVNLLVNEESLTGESVAIHKESVALANPATALHLAHNIVFSGTTVVTGSGTGIVFAIGNNTVLGGIAEKTTEVVRVSRFEQELKKFSMFILYIVVITLVFMFGANLLIKGWDTDVAQLAIFSIALAVSVVPEALPVVMTFALSRGARRLAKNHVIVKRLSSIEDLGSIEILCTDKTGTLTHNKLTVHETYNVDAKTSHQDIIFAGNLGGSYLLMKNRRQGADPFDTALWEALSPEERAHLASYQHIKDIPFDPVRKMNSVLLEKDSATTLFVRGAPEAILGASTSDEDTRAEILAWVCKEGQAGRRSLAIASKALGSREYDEINDEVNLTFVGCISFIDPIKKSAREAIKDAEKLGIGIKILTGDSFEVAHAVAREVGLAQNKSEVMTAHDFFMLHDDDRLKALERISTFARVSPLEKYNIIQLLQKKYQVGFLGEGINDAPALKIANVAIVVESASDIAREAADIILLEKNLSVVIQGIREGRATFANTIKYIRSSLSSNFGNFYAVAISSLFIPFLPMLPLQILLVNLLSDFPAIAIATDTVEDEDITRPQEYSIKKILAFGTILGIVSTIFDFITFASFYLISAAALQTHWFMVSILTEILFLYSIRSRVFFLKARAPSLPLVTLSIAAFIATIALPFTSFGQSVFGFIAPSRESLGLVLGIVVAYFVTTEIVKLIYYKINEPPVKNYTKQSLTTNS